MNDARDRTQAQRGGHPAERRFTIGQIRGDGDLRVSECVITYDGVPAHSLSFMEFSGDPFPAAAWRAALAEPAPGPGQGDRRG